MSTFSLDGNGLTVRISVDGGGRIARLVDADGDDWLVTTDRPEATSTVPIPFVDGTRGGWDECLPSISPCPDPNRPASIADHGDFWYLGWEVSAHDRWRVSLRAPDRGHPLSVGKTVELIPGEQAIRVTVHATNTSDAAYRMLYSAHPLWRWPASASLGIAAATTLRTAFGPEWEPQQTATWPYLNGHDMRRIQRDGLPENFKFFVRWRGSVRLSFDDRDKSLLLSQDHATSPWLGVCVNRDAWPASEPGESWIALEPTTSPTDSLAEAVLDHAAVEIPAGGMRAWVTTVRIERAAE